jgi:CysZ protein
MSEPAQTLQDPREGHLLARLFRGFGYLFRGFDFVLDKNPSLLKFCVAPLLISLLILSGVGVLLYFYYGDLVNWIWARPESWLLRILWYLMYVFIFLLVMLLGYITFFVLQAIVAAPFNDILSEQVEALAYGKEPPPFSMARLGRGLLLTVGHELLKLGVYLGIMLPLLLCKFIPLLGPPVLLFGGFYVTAVFTSYDFMDFSMARRELPWKTKWGLLKGNRALTMGFGASLATALLVPVVGSVCVPMAAVGGTLLFCDLERAGALENEESSG